MPKSQIKSKERVAEHGEVFTNEREINAMLDMVKDESCNIESTFLEYASEVLFFFSLISASLDSASAINFAFCSFASAIAFSSNCIKDDLDKEYVFGKYILTGSSTPADKTEIQHDGAGRIVPLKFFFLIIIFFFFIFYFFK